MFPVLEEVQGCSQQCWARCHLLVPFNNFSQHMQFTLRYPAHVGFGWEYPPELGIYGHANARGGEEQACQIWEKENLLCSCFWVTLTPALPCCSTGSAAVPAPRPFHSNSSNTSISHTFPWLPWAAGAGPLRKDLLSAKLSFPFFAGLA